MQKYPLLLASQSPRRAEILQMLGLDFTVRAFDTDETMDPLLNPLENVEMLAQRKAQSAWEELLLPDTVILGADTVVSYNGEVLGKPKDEEDARRMLTLLSGKTHTVDTGIAVLLNGTVFSASSESHVTFRALSKREIDSYIASGEPMDKAGAYGIQAKGSLLVSSLEGDFFGVMGLSPAVVRSLLSEHFGWNIMTGE